MGLLTGKVTVITGAGHGIGRATALLFAEHGAHVVVNDIGTTRDGSGSADRAPAQAVVDTIAAGGGRAYASGHDISTESGAQALMDAAVHEFGQVDVLINNAGIIRDKTLLKMTAEQWQAVIDVHLGGTFFCMRAAARHMKQRGQGGRIVNTTSISGMLGNYGQSNYASAKAGVYGLTRTASIELQRYGIWVNAVAPLAKTRLTEDLPIFEKIHDSMTALHVAPAHLFFASELSESRTGHVLSVVGGKLSVYRMVESAGRFKEADNGVWSAEEIRDHFDSIGKF